MGWGFHFTKDNNMSYDMQKKELFTVDKST